MSQGERVTMGFVAIVSATLLIRGLRRGEMTGEYNDHSLSEQPIQFALSMVGYGLAFVFSVFLALGLQPQELWGWATWYLGRS